MYMFIELFLKLNNIMVGFSFLYFMFLLPSFLYVYVY